MIQDALAFLRDARRDEALAGAVDALDDDGTLDGLVKVAAAAGYDVTGDQVERAFALDWSMRWARYRGG